MTDSLSKTIFSVKVSLMSGLSKTIIWVIFYWFINLCLTAVALFPGRPKQMCKGFPSMMNGLFKTIFQVKISYRLDQLLLLGDLNNQSVCVSLSLYISLRSRQLKWGAISFWVMWHYWHWHHVMPTTSYIPTELQHDFFVIWHHWHWHQHNIMPTTTSMGLLLPTVKTAEIRCNLTSLVKWCNWHQCQQHVMPMALSITPLNSLGHDNGNGLQHDIFGHVTPFDQCQYPMIPLALVSASHDTNGTFALLRPRCLKWGATWSFRISGIFLKKQKFYLNQDKLLPNLQDGFLRPEGKCYSQQNCCQKCS